MCKDWADYSEALDAFWADHPEPKLMAVDDRELWHAFAAKAEQRALVELGGKRLPMVVTPR